MSITDRTAARRSTVRRTLVRGGTLVATAAAGTALAIAPASAATANTSDGGLYVDTNGNGYYETWYGDGNGDGRYDTVHVDSNEDGTFDAAAWDSSGDGYFDRYDISPYDGVFETYDLNQDGYADGSSSVSLTVVLQYVSHC